jgi:hypothetical protein
MHPDDALDVLLNERAAEHARAGRALHSANKQANDELAPLLEAAARLNPLHDAAPSAAFADDLEQRVLARLGQRSQPVQRGRLTSFGAGVGAAPAKLAWAGIAAALLLTIGLGVFTAQAAPGQPLYPVRQLAQHAAANVFPAPTSAALAALTRANADLAAYDAATARGDTAAALATLPALRADDAQASSDAIALQDASARQAALAQVAQFRRRAQSDLRASLAALTWEGRAQVTDQLRAWGDATLMVAQARVLADSSSEQNPRPGDNSALLVVTGAGFAPGAQALVNGQAVGTLISLTPTRMTTRIDTRVVNGTTLVIAIENPDGTVAMTAQVARDDNGAPDHTATPGGGNHGGNHGGGDGSGSESTPSPGADATSAKTFR